MTWFKVFKSLPVAASAALFVLCLPGAPADEPIFAVIKLPALQIDEQPARAHTQGLEVIAGSYYVTARRDDKVPKRAMLLRTNPRRADWDAWDITPLDAQGKVTALDHPGGIQSDGARLWIPLAESKRNGRSLIRGFPLSAMVPGRPLKADTEFAIDDHVGALAVLAQRGALLGASWDTETIYVWDFAGQLQRTFSEAELAARGLGAVSGLNGRSGLAVQDWKGFEGRLVASGLFKGQAAAPGLSQSRLMSFAAFLGPGFQRVSIELPKQDGIELSREAMAIADGQIHFLPDDLGPTNRLFQVSLADLMVVRN